MTAQISRTAGHLLRLIGWVSLGLLILVIASLAATLAVLAILG